MQCEDSFSAVLKVMFVSNYYLAVFVYEAPTHPREVPPPRAHREAPRRGPAHRRARSAAQRSAVERSAAADP